MNENEVVYEADEYDRASVEFLASEFMIENRRQPTIEELHVLQTGFTAGIKFMNKLIEESCNE
uniref:Uncharacterized protein n=1 Tax=Siphoviridae sp. ctt1f11 TaxID=2827959 RepID=A0A8S5SCM1_9CAUD|nr:MAG TPA: hypothetical protein [Siphoviridae sp. ctt1f11]